MNDMVFAVVLVVLVAVAVLGVVRLIGWLVLRRSSEETFETVDDAFELAYRLFGNDTWTQVIVSRTSDGYIATAHNRTRTLAVSASRFAVTPEDAVQVLCEDLRLAIDRKTKGTPLDGESEDPEEVTSGT